MSSGLTGKHFLLENYELVWKKDDIKRFREAWEDGMAIKEIAEYMRTTEAETVLLGIDQFGIKQVKVRLRRDESAKHIW